MTVIVVRKTTTMKGVSVEPCDLGRYKRGSTKHSLLAQYILAKLISMPYISSLSKEFVDALNKKNSGESSLSYR